MRYAHYVEAAQFLGKPISNELKGVLNSNESCRWNDSSGLVLVKTPERCFWLHRGEWVVRESERND